ncbi:MAG: hypothetical protein PUE71_00015 [Clostridia bacterium]|nr:hypothetical protein [Clostridia bacterium]
MKDKRISLRFREEKEQEIEAWECLEAYARQKNISKNAALIDLILSSSRTDNSMDEMAERIADAVAEKLIGKLVPVQTGSGAKEGTAEMVSADASESEAVSLADEPLLLGEEAIDFLTMFG